MVAPSSESSSLRVSGKSEKSLKILSDHNTNAGILDCINVLPVGSKVIDTNQDQIPDILDIRQDDIKITKNYSNSFKKTDLHKVLQEHKCNTLLLGGFSAVGCVISSYFGARDLDYTTFMLKVAIMSPNTELTEIIETTFEAVGYEVVDFILRQTSKPGKK